MSFEGDAGHQEMTDESDCTLVAIAPRLEPGRWPVAARPTDICGGFHRILSHVLEISMRVTAAGEGPDGSSTDGPRSSVVSS
jgi:hypothetical protein